MQSVFYQTQWQLFALKMDAETTSSLFSVCFKSFSVLVELLLVGCSDIAEPLSVWLDSTSMWVGRPFSHLFVVGLFFVHVQPINSCAISELGSSFAAGGVRPVRI